MNDRRIFISYRRDDGAEHAMHVKQRLEQEFGANCAFIDVDDMRSGYEYRIQLTQEVATCDILLAVIGPRWIELLNNRIDDRNDPVRAEVGQAISQSVFIIPILLDGTKMPEAADLPEDLKDLPSRHGVPLRLASFRNDLNPLIRDIRDRFNSPMLARFEGARLERAFKAQELVCNNDGLAKKLIQMSKLQQIEDGQTLYSQTDPGKNFLYFLLSGRLSLSDAGERFYDVKPNEVVGEFPILLTDQSKYAVTVTARETSVVARISEDQFRLAAREYPELWENMARMLAKRLRDSRSDRNAAR